MCGINGCLHRKNLSFSSEEFKTATNLLFKRGPDSSGITEEILDDYILKFGHRRLSILGIDESGNQPMNSLGERFSIIYNGEIYNHNSLRKELNKNLDIKWHGNCDTETLVNLFEFDSIDNVLKKIEGMFSFAIYDRKKQHFSMIYYGASLQALAQLGTKKGYTFVCCNKAGNNAFFIKKELVNDRVKLNDLSKGFYKNKFRESRDENGNLTYLSNKEENNLLFNLPLEEV